MQITDILLGYPSHQSVTSHATKYLPWWLQILWSIFCNSYLRYDVLVYKFFFKLYDSLWKITGLVCFYICFLIKSSQHMKEPFPIELLLSARLDFKLRYNIMNIEFPTTKRFWLYHSPIVELLICLTFLSNPIHTFSQDPLWTSTLRSCQPWRMKFLSLSKKVFIIFTNEDDFFVFYESIN